MAVYSGDIDPLFREVDPWYWIHSSCEPGLSLPNRQAKRVIWAKSLRKHDLVRGLRRQQHKLQPQRFLHGKLV